jgi:hypothetical protein
MNCTLEYTDENGDKKKYSVDEFAAMLHDGHLNELIKNGSISEDTLIGDKAILGMLKGVPSQSGIKKSLVSDEIISKVNLDKISDKEMHALGKQIIETKEVDPVKIVRDISEGDHRALQPKEVVALIYHKTQLDNKLRDAYARKAELKSTEDSISVDREINDLQKDVENYEIMSVITANQQSLAFRLRKGLLNKDYELADQINKYKATNKNNIPADVEAKMVAMDNKYQELKKSIEKQEKESEQKKGEQTISSIKKEAGKRKTSAPSSTNRADSSQNKKIKAASKILANKLRSSKLSRPGMFSAATPVSLIWDGAIEAVALSIEAGGSVAQSVQSGLGKIKESEWYKELSSDKKSQAESEFESHIELALSENDSTDSKIKIPKSVIRDLVEGGVDNINDLTIAVKDAVSDIYPNATEREIRDAITQYGETIELSQEDIDVRIRKMKRLGKLISQLEDVRNKIRPLRSGMQRDVMEAEERSLAKEVKELMKDLPIDDTTHERQLKTSLETAKTRIKNQIEDLTKQIKTGVKTGKPKKIEYDSQMQDLVDQRDALKEIYNKVFNNKKLSDEQKIASAERALDKVVAELERKVKERDVSGAKTHEELKSEKLSELRDRKKELNDALDKIKEEEGVFELERIESAEKAIQREIIELERQISNNELTPKEKKTQAQSEKLSELRDRKKELNNTLTGLREDAGIIEANKIKAAEKAAEKAIEELERQINELDFKEKQKPSPVTSAKLENLRDTKKRLQDEKKGLNEPKKIEDYNRSIRRAIIKINDDIDNNMLEAKKPAEKPSNAETEALLDQKKEALERMRGLREAAGVFEKRRLETAKKNVAKKITSLTERIKNKDFSTKKKSTSPSDLELEKLKAEAQEIRDEYDKLHFENEIKNRTFTQKASDAATELLTGLPRALVASLDFSAVLVQGALMTFRHPILALRALKKMFMYFASDKYQKEDVAKIKTSPLYNEMKASKLAITEISGKFNAKEEMFVSNWVSAIWNLPGGIVKKALGDNKFSEQWKKKDPYQASNRAFNGYINSMRMSIFLEFKQHLEKQGETFESNPDAYKAAADYINNASGRGSLGKFEHSSKILGLAFFSPRKIVSGINLMSPWAIAYFTKMPKHVRQKAILDYASSLSIMVTIAVLADMALTDDEDEDKEDHTFWNPTSSDFLKPKIGETRVDIFRGLQQNVVLFSRIATGTLTEVSGKKTILGERFGKDVNTEGDAILKYFANKVSPTASLSWKLLDQKKGKELDPGEEVAAASMPMWSTEALELYKTHPTEIATMLTILSVLGAGVNTYTAHSEGKKGHHHAKPKKHKKSESNQ